MFEQSIDKLEEMLMQLEKEIFNLQRVLSSLKTKEAVYDILNKTLQDIKKLQKEEAEINNESES